MVQVCARSQAWGERQQICQKEAWKPLYVAAFLGKAKNWNENNPIMVKQQRVYSSETLQQSSSVRLD